MGVQCPCAGHSHANTDRGANRFSSITKSFAINTNDNCVTDSFFFQEKSFEQSFYTPQLFVAFFFFCCCLIFVFFISSSWNVYIYTFPLLLLLTTCRTVRKKANHCVISPSVNQACVLFLFFFFPSAVMFYVRFTPPVNPDICSWYSPPHLFLNTEKKGSIFTSNLFPSCSCGEFFSK